MIIQSGPVTRKGLVLNKADRALTGLLANQTLGVILVANHLATEPANQAVRKRREEYRLNRPPARSAA